MFALMAIALAIAIDMGVFALGYLWIIPLVALEIVFDAALYSLWKAGKSQSRKDIPEVDTDHKVL